MTRDIRAVVSAYKDLFRGPVADIVLEDLERFCHAHATTHVIGDPYGSAQLEGRRQVALRIRRHMNADDQAIAEAIEYRENVDE